MMLSIPLRFHDEKQPMDKAWKALLYYKRECKLRKT